MNGFTDIHSHFIYGMDDGARTKADMEAMLDAAHADGITTLFATPHMTPGLQPFDISAYRRRLNEARSYCRSRDYAMTIHAGAEILYTPALRSYAVDHRLQTLADSDAVLLEFLPDVALGEIEAALDLMERYGYVTVLAHVERYECLFRGDCLCRMKERYDVRYQVNTNTVLSRRGFFQTRLINRWFQWEQIDFIASDAHDVRSRPFRMKGAYDALVQVYGQHYALTLTGAQRP